MNASDARTPHRVRRLRWQARAGDAAAALALRALLRQRGDGVAAALSQVLDGAVPAGQVLRLARCEVRLKAPSVEALASGLERQLADALVDALAHALVPAPAQPARADGRPPASATRRDARVDAIRAERERLLDYLDRGNLDWTLAGLRAPVLRERLQAAARELAADPRAAPAAWPADGPSRERWLVRWFALLEPGQRIETAAALRLEIGLPAAGPDAPRRGAAPADFARWAGAAPPVQGEARDDPVPGLPPAPASAQPAPAPAVDAEPGRLVPDAGLLLLHPYLPRLLAACGHVDDAHARAVAPSRRPRAAALLHFLAHGAGDEPAFEYELPFVKLLLGMEPEEPLSPVACDEGDRAEGLALLDAVLGHWTALGRTGVDTLRTTFLQRRGLLERGGADGWRLRVQAQGVDVLLGRLPWGIGRVRLPWMPRPLAVEWTAP